MTPEPTEITGPGLLWFLGVVAGAWVAGWLVRRLLVGWIAWVERRGGAAPRVLMARSVAPLVSWAAALAAVHLALGWLHLPPQGEVWLHVGVQIGFALVAAVVAARWGRFLLERWEQAAADPEQKQMRRTLGPFLAKSLLITTVVLAMLLTLQNAGFNVAGLLAGLGIGGLAVALAAKDTLANLLGSLTIMLDGPFAVGDEIACGEVQGRVEHIGLRSCRLRRADGAMVTIPNQKVADSVLVNLTRRPGRRRSFTVLLPTALAAREIPPVLEAMRSAVAAVDGVGNVRVVWRTWTEAPVRVELAFELAPADGASQDAALQQVNLALRRVLDGAAAEA